MADQVTIRITGDMEQYMRELMEMIVDVDRYDNAVFSQKLRQLCTRCREEGKHHCRDHNDPCPQDVLMGFTLELFMKATDRFLYDS